MDEGCLVSMHLWRELGSAGALNIHSSSASYERPILTRDRYHGRADARRPPFEAAIAPRTLEETPELKPLRDKGDHRATAADRIALYLAEMQNARIGDADVTYDRHAALEVLGGALSLVPGLVDEAGPINVEAELRAVVALTRHHWANRVNVLLDAPARTPAFWGRWWVARIAAMRMLMLAADGHESAPSNFNQTRLPPLHFIGRLVNSRFELRTIVDRSAPATSEPDPVLLLCAKCLDGEIMTAFPNNGGVLTSFQFPVRLVGVIPEQRAG